MKKLSEMNFAEQFNYWFVKMEASFSCGRYPEASFYWGHLSRNIQHGRAGRYSEELDIDQKEAWDKSYYMIRLPCLLHVAHQDMKRYKEPCVGYFLAVEKQIEEVSTILKEWEKAGKPPYILNQHLPKGDARRTKNQRRYKI